MIHLRRINYFLLLLLSLRQGDREVEANEALQYEAFNTNDQLVVNMIGETEKLTFFDTYP